MNTEMDRLPIVQVTDTWFWREYRAPDGTLIQRDHLFRVWWQESSEFIRSPFRIVSFRLGLWLVRNGATRCPDCHRTHSIRENIQ